jgi:prevent-host-death family protein
MVRITATEFQRNIGRYQDVALTEPVTITKDGRDRTVILSAEEYQRLKRRDRIVMGLDDFDAADIEAIAVSEPPDEAAEFDDELAVK